MSESNVKGKITAKADIRATATVIRGAESWQFFAFIFAAVAAIGLSLIEELHVEAALAVGSRVRNSLLVDEKTLSADQREGVKFEIGELGQLVGCD